jgi:hypothetical protein
MEQRYGFPAEEAVGQVSHDLLRTASWLGRTEIDAVLVDRQTWNGGLIHYRADGQPVIAANHWCLHRASGDCEPLVTELHSDIVTPGTEAGSQLADVMTTIAQQLSQPLTAAGSYMRGADRAQQPVWPDRERLNQGISAAIAQLARTAQELSRLRALGNGLRGSHQIARLHRSCARLTATFEETGRIARETFEVVEASRAIIAESVSAREESRRLRGVSSPATPRSVHLRNIQLFRRLLQQDNGDVRDPQTARSLGELLLEEEEKLALLDRP